MSENNDNSNKTITIKVRLSDEDYHDITIDFSDESYENKYQLFFRKIASFIGVPIGYITTCNFHTTTEYLWLPNPESHCFNLYPDLVTVDDTFIQSLNDGDRFFIRVFLCLMNHQCPFDLYVDLFSSDSELIHPTECTNFYCQIINSRAWLNKKKEILFNSEIFPQVRAGLPEERHEGGEDQWVNTLVNFNIRQYFNACCYRQVMRDTIHRRRYLPHRG